MGKINRLKPLPDWRLVIGPHFNNMLTQQVEPYLAIEAEPFAVLEDHNPACEFAIEEEFFDKNWDA
ncbi:MAG: hypothetical protein GY874_03890 [Desulfobacteraceae bacterium]|nr:hypothetical protein [Desulfobacteraceae bacterium]